MINNLFEKPATITRKECNSILKVIDKCRDICSNFTIDIFEDCESEYEKGKTTGRTILAKEILEELGVEW